MLAGCAAVSESRLNPFNWFGQSREVEAIAITPDSLIDGRPLLDQVVSLRVDATPGGAVVHAVGLPPQQGWFDGELIASNRGRAVDGVLEYRFYARPPFRPTRLSTQRSREIVVAVALSNQALRGVREIRVVAARNARAVRR
ncbi:hypothetical protein DXV76_01815 [Rhodobacteraceae bacterium CCMM004]|nr:hypothetical protein DXV76_01815 [Rhodobacteraceae bacterium CCMM004]